MNNQADDYKAMSTRNLKGKTHINLSKDPPDGIDILHFANTQILWKKKCVVVPRKPNCLKKPLLHCVRRITIHIHTLAGGIKPYDYKNRMKQNFKGSMVKKITYKGLRSSN